MHPHTFFFRAFVRIAIFGELALSPILVRAQTAASSTIPTDAPYKDAKLPVDRRVADLLKRMTLDEKVTMLSGSGWMESAPIERLGIPAIKMADGPMACAHGRAARR